MISKSTLLMSLSFTAVIIFNQSVNACRWTRVYRSLTNQTSHHSFPIGSTHNLSTSRGSVSVTVQQRSSVEGFHIPNSAMSRLGFPAETNNGTACF